MVLRVVGNLLLLLLLRRRWTLNLLDVGRLMLGRDLGVGVLRRGVVTLCWRLGWGRLVGRVGMMLLLLVLWMLWMLWVLWVMLLVMDHSGPRMVHRKMIWRRQALRRVGVMLEAHVS
ncbi:hypothetical protein T440DRAFT_111372 [Plenodomus tracheiphilus IPT5]|uniref:Uncharacterized protein n=1 Tax=Plenodomus tracheiphilus IPT5 TaxID=1408161 RepID=A0A6A7B7U6_9PLEO|nr:hypothetical protein T440DRAFT_111372 [Plenodomus tracheiphilus IPT5]